jgi:capsular polysaccharide biosynthesis protein
LDTGPLRVNQEPQSFELLNSIVGKIKLVQKFDQNVYLDRTTTINRFSKQAAEVRGVAQSKGYLCIDPGLLNPIEEFSLFRFSRRFAGFMGSQFLLGFLSTPSSQFSILSYDNPQEFRGFSWAFAPRDVNWYLGTRDVVIPGFGDLISHRDHTFSENLLNSFYENL